MTHTRARLIILQTPEQESSDGTDAEEPHSCWENDFLPGDLEEHVAAVRGTYNISANMKAWKNLHVRRRLTERDR